jgi:predicted CoA-binding protein
MPCRLRQPHVRGAASGTSSTTNDNNMVLDVLYTVRTIAMVGASNTPTRPSYGVMKFLLDKGYT